MRQQGRAGSQGRPPEALRAATAEGVATRAAADVAVAAAPAQVGHLGPSDVSASCFVVAAM